MAAGSNSMKGLGNAKLWKQSMVSRNLETNKQSDGAEEMIKQEAKGRIALQG